MPQNPDEFKVMLFERFAWFFTWSVQVMEKGSWRRTVFRGKPGMQRCLHWLRHTFANSPATLHAELLKPLAGFGWLMDRDIQVEYIAWVTQATKLMEAAGDDELEEIGWPEWTTEFEEAFSGRPVAAAIQDAQHPPDQNLSPNTKKRRLGNDKGTTIVSMSAAEAQGLPSAKFDLLAESDEPLAALSAAKLLVLADLEIRRS